MVEDNVSHKDTVVLHGTKNIVPCKTCIKCKHEKHISEFHRNSSKKDGRQADCKICVSQKKKIGYKRKTEDSSVLISYISSKLDSDALGDFANVFSEGIKGLIESGELK